MVCNNIKLLKKYFNPLFFLGIWVLGLSDILQKKSWHSALAWTIVWVYIWLTVWGLKNIRTMTAEQGKEQD